MAPADGGARQVPALEKPRAALTGRAWFDFFDYGFQIAGSLSDVFDIVPIDVTEEEAFVFFYPRADLGSGRFSLFNLHAFLKRTGTVDDFAHGLGPSVRTILLTDTTVAGVPARTYRRTITMAELFAGEPQIIEFIGGTPELEVTDSHVFFIHRHNHYYSGMLHQPIPDDRYERLRATLFEGIRLS